MFKPTAAGAVLLCVSVCAGLLMPQPARAQSATSPATSSPEDTAPSPEAPAKSRAFKTPSKAAFSGLEVVPWFSLAPQGAGLIRSPGGQNSMDLATREDQTDITVYGRKKVVDLHADREHDYSAPGWSDFSMPKELPIGVPGSCPGSSYRTIGGQPATGADMVGGLGGGRC